MTLARGEGREKQPDPSKRLPLDSPASKGYAGRVGLGVSRVGKKRPLDKPESRVRLDRREGKPGRQRPRAKQWIKGSRGSIAA